MEGGVQGGEGIGEVHDSKHYITFRTKFQYLLTR